VTAIRRARRDDLPALIELLRDDPLGAARESTDPAPYAAAFDALDADPNQFLACMETADGTVIGTLQLTVVPGLSRAGQWRGQIEAVRVRADHRGGGAGRELVRWAIAEARRRGCGLVQLTTDRTRVDAHRFYARLGFVDSHLGFKLPL
jgi:GNAT superfamily N-acetyltransferase